MDLKYTDDTRADDTDTLIAVMGITISILLTVYLEFKTHNLVYDMSGILAGSAFAGWFFLKKKATLKDLRATRGRSFILMTFLSFTILFLLSIIIIWLRPNQYERPLAYFVCASLMSSIVGIEIIFAKLNRIYVAAILLQITAIGISLESIELFIFPTVVGIDPWWHQMFNQIIVKSGHIPHGYYYASYPIFHVQVAEASLITETSYKVSSMLSISVVQVIVDTLFIYLVGRLVGKERIGLLAGLAVITANRHIMAGFWIEPITIAGILTPIIVYSLLKWKGSKRNTALLISIGLMLALLLTHPLAVLFMALALSAGWICFNLPSVVHEVGRVPISLSIVLFFWAGTLATWSIFSGAMATLVDLILSGFGREFFSNPPDQVSRYSALLPMAEQIFNNLGLLLFYMLSLIGCLYLISRKHGNPLHQSIAIFGLIPLTLSYFSLILERGIVESRWLYISQIWLSIPVAVAVIVVVNCLKKDIHRLAFVSILVFVLTFLMIMSTAANIDNRTFSRDSGVRVALTDSELRAGETLKTVTEGRIETDSFFSSALLYSGVNATSIDSRIVQNDFVRSSGNVVLLREEVVYHPFFLSSALPWKLDYDIRKSLDDKYFDKIFDCGSVSGYS